jgi:hypothetical protein
MFSDVLKGAFELGGALFISVNIHAVLRDRAVKGVSWLPSAFFILSGGYNCYFLPLFGCWLAFTGNLLAVLANLVYLFLLLRYSRKKDPSC